MPRALVIATLVALAATAAAFWLQPGLDLAVARVFFRDGAFWGGSSVAKAYRYFFYWLPMGLLALYAIAYGLRRAGIAAPGAGLATGRGLAFLALSMALGPGLLVNVGLKDHWHRPRPAQVSEFGGPYVFRPFWRGDGACPRNCSFVSGEVSSAAWLIAPALLAPPPLRAPALAAAVAVTVLTALGRLAFGGHFLSDVLFAATFTFLLIELLHWLLFRRGKARE